MYVRPLTVACDISHVFTVNVSGLIELLDSHSADELQGDCYMSYDFAVFASAVTRLEMYFISSH